MGIRLLPTALATAAAACLSFALVPAAQAHYPAGPVVIGEKDPERGMAWGGLKVPAPGGICAGLLKVEGEPGSCTHGPDPAPAGVDVRDRPTTAELVEESKDGERLGGGTPAETSVACLGTGTDGPRVQVIYARPSNVPDRWSPAFSALLHQWAAEASGVFDASAAQTGGSRRIKYVTDSGAAGCELAVQRLTLTAAGDDDFDNTLDEIRDRGAAFTRSDRKYMVFMDSNVFCGIGEIRNDSRDVLSNMNNGVNTVQGMIGRTDVGCWGQLADDNSTEAHELVHNLGGVQLDAPNASGGWHCTDEYDTECYSDSPAFPPMRFLCPFAQEKTLDCNDDDYFNTNPAVGTYIATHWNVADSAFLAAGGGPSGPFNDDFSSAQGVAGRDMDRVGDTSVGADKQTGEPNHAGTAGGASIWYSWTAPGPEPVTIDTVGSAFDTVLGVYTGSAVNALTEVASDDDDGAGVTSSVTFSPVSGRTYAIAVDGVGGVSGSVNLSIAQEAPDAPVNDLFANAIELVGSGAAREADRNEAAAKEAGEPAHAGNPGGASIWYRWTAPASGTVTIDTRGSSFDTTLGVYTGSSVGGLSTIASNDDEQFDAALLTSRLSFAASAGTTYAIAIDGFKSTADPAEVGTVAINLDLGPTTRPTGPGVGSLSSAGSATPQSQVTVKRKCKKRKRGSRKKRRCRR